jgi:hypothetical protein
MRNEFMAKSLQQGVDMCDSRIARLRGTERACNAAGGERRSKWNRDWREVWDTRAKLSSMLAAATPLDYMSREDLVREVLLIEAERREKLADEHHKGNVKLSQEANALRKFVYDRDAEKQAVA